MLETSTTTAKLDAALAKAQAKFRAAAKDSVNPHFRSSYADLASIAEACWSALTAEGISVTQWLTHAADDRLHIVTRLAHSGEFLMAEWSMPVSKQDPQGYGSAATYARRYTLAAAVGVVSDDDDGQAASEAPKKQAPRESARKAMERAQKEVQERAEDLDPDGLKMRIQLAASVSVEELDSLGPEIEKVADDMLKERLRRFQAEHRKRAISRAEAKRIASGAAPAQPEDAS